MEKCFCGNPAGYFFIDINARKYGQEMRARYSLCAKCAKRIVPIFTEAMDMADKEVSDIYTERNRTND